MKVLKFIIGLPVLVIVLPIYLLEWLVIGIHVLIRKISTGLFLN